MTALLVIDCETTSLHVPSLTVLECSWVISDLNGLPRMPLQHRYLRISKSRTPIFPIASDEKTNYWCSGIHLLNSESEKFARKMAEDSGLFGDWLACDVSNILYSADELTRLLLDDIASFCDPGETIHICGAGAARFDFSILALHCPRVVIPTAPGEKSKIHYRPVDTSGSLTALLGSNHEAAIIKWFSSRNADFSRGITLDSSPRFCYENTDVDCWLAGACKHRAAPDVVRSLVTQRALWAYGQLLRDSLQICIDDLVL